MFKLPTAKEFAEKLNQMSDDEFDTIYRKLIDKCENNGHNWKLKKTKYIHWVWKTSHVQLSALITIMTTNFGTRFSNTWLNTILIRNMLECPYNVQTIGE